MFLGLFVFIGLWIGYRNNEIQDEKKRVEKILAAKKEKARLEKIASLYPKNK